MKRNSLQSLLHTQSGAEALISANSIMHAALALCGPYLAIRMNGDGQIHLIAKQEGILLINQERLQHLKQHYPNITITCGSSFCPVERGYIVASITSDFTLSSDFSTNNIFPAPALQVVPYRPISAFLVQTFLPSNETVERIAAHLHTVRGELVGEERCLHEPDAVAAALDRAISIQPDLILVSSPADSDIPPAKLGIRLNAQTDSGRILYGTVQKCPVLCLTSRLFEQTELTGILQRMAAGLELDDQSLSVP